jgi:hypothetical protein
MTENVPQAVDLGMQTPGKLLLKNQGANDILIGYDRSDVLAATAANYMTLDAGTLLVFDVGPGIGFVNQASLMWFNATGGNSTLEVWIATP